MMFGRVVETVEERARTPRPHPPQVGPQARNGKRIPGLYSLDLPGRGYRLRIRGVQNPTTPMNHLRMIALSRIMLPNIKTSRRATVGKRDAQLCLHGGARFRFHYD